MNELIKIQDNNGKKAVSAHELYNFLCENQTESFGRWWSRNSEYGFVENIDYQRVTFFTQWNNQENVDYALTLDCAKEISMIQRSEKGKIARQYFIACEERAMRPLDTISRKDLAKMLLESEEEKERLLLTAAEQERQLKESAPKVEYYDKCLESKGYLTVNMIAADLGVSHIKLNKLLCDWGVQYKQTDTYFLTSRYRNMGYTVHRPWAYTDSNGQIKTRQHMYWTEIGKKFIIELYHTKIGRAA